MEYSPFMLALGCMLALLGACIACYLFNVGVGAQERWEKFKEPEYVREINKKLTCNNVETERDLL